MGDLSLACRIIGQGHPRVMTYINFCIPPFIKIFVIYSHGGHLGHVTMMMTIYASFHSLFLRMLHIKFGFDWPSSFREDV